MENHIDNLIISRLGERQRKLNLMKDFQHKLTVERKKNKSKSLIIVSVAASLIIALTLFPSIYRHFSSGSNYNLVLTTPDFNGYRGNGVDLIEISINDGNLQRAKNLVDLSIMQSRAEINNIMNSDTGNEEEKNYLLDLENDYLEELMWTRIFIFYKMQNKELILSSCQEYMQQDEYKHHREEVNSILNEFK